MHRFSPLVPVLLLPLVTACSEDQALVGPEPQAASPELISPLASQRGNPVPTSVIVTHDGLEWVWASPCALGGCTAGIDVGHDGFRFATEAEWARRPDFAVFIDDELCAAPWFDHSYDNCDWIDAVIDEEFGAVTQLSYYGSAPSGEGGPAGTYGYPMDPAADTWLVRGPDAPPEPLRIGVNPESSGTPTIQSRSKGVTPVALYGSASFDVEEVVAASLRFGPLATPPSGSRIVDVDLDGFPDLVSTYRTQALGLTAALEDE
jgi:hypothetical protein